MVVGEDQVFGRGAGHEATERARRDPHVPDRAADAKRPVATAVPRRLLHHAPDQAHVHLTAATALDALEGRRQARRQVLDAHR